MTYTNPLFFECDQYIIPFAEVRYVEKLDINEEGVPSALQVILADSYQTSDETWERSPCLYHDDVAKFVRMWGGYLSHGT